MSNVLVTLFVVVLMMVAVVSWSQASFDSFDSAAQSWKLMAETAEDVSRTDIEVISANSTAPFVDVLIHNSGKVHLAQFPQWDVLVQYYGNTTYCVGSLSYTEESVPSDNQWTVITIYSDDTMAQQEVYEPKILNPGEVMLMRLKLNPSPGVDTVNRVTLSSPNGVVASAQFQG